uniref:Cytosol aminopeptidase n=1 Tax=Mesocestoides corti TaxID=53468 RepID=A0A5K3FSC3_MESCO
MTTDSRNLTSSVQSDLQKKKMPLIMTYNSDEDEEDDLDEDTRPLSELRLSYAAFPGVDSIDLTCDDSNSSSNSESNELQIISDSRSDQINLPIWVESNSFQRLQRTHSVPSSIEKERVPHSFVVFFYEAVKSGAVPSGLPFGAVWQAMMTQWKKLSCEERKVRCLLNHLVVSWF